MQNVYNQVDNRRKVMVVSMSWVELGQGALSKNDCWMTLAVARTRGVLDIVDGGWSALARILLEDLFFGDVGLSTVGLAIPSPRGHVMLYGALKNILADGDGLRLGFNWRGASSLKPCLVHHNVLMKALGLQAAKLALTSQGHAKTRRCQQS